MDSAFAFFRDIMRWWGDNSPLSYGQVNVLLFLVIEPLLIFSFFMLGMKALKTKDKSTKSVIEVGSILLIMFLVVATIIFLIGIPFIDVALVERAHSLVGPEMTDSINP